GRLRRSRRRRLYDSFCLPRLCGLAHLVDPFLNLFERLVHLVGDFLNRHALSLEALQRLTAREHQHAGLGTKLVNKCQRLRRGIYLIVELAIWKNRDLAQIVGAPAGFARQVNEAALDQGSLGTQAYYLVTVCFASLEAA